MPELPDDEGFRPVVAGQLEGRRPPHGAAGVEAGRVPPRPSWLTGAREADDPRCPRGDAALELGAVAGRSTWWCLRCQSRR